MANRKMVYDAIDGERAFQDEKWGTSEEHPHEVGAWLTIMRTLLSKADKQWMSRRGDFGSLDVIRKLAASGVACMEEHGVVFRLDAPSSPGPSVDHTKDADSLCYKIRHRPEINLTESNMQPGPVRRVVDDEVPHRLRVAELERAIELAEDDKRSLAGLVVEKNKRIAELVTIRADHAKEQNRDDAGPRESDKDWEQIAKKAEGELFVLQMKLNKSQARFKIFRDWVNDRTRWPSHANAWLAFQAENPEAKNWRDDGGQHGDGREQRQPNNVTLDGFIADHLEATDWLNDDAQRGESKTEGGDSQQCENAADGSLAPDEAIADGGAKIILGLEQKNAGLIEEIGLVRKVADDRKALVEYEKREKERFARSAMDRGKRLKTMREWMIGSRDRWPLRGKGWNYFLGEHPDSLMWFDENGKVLPPISMEM